MLLACLTFSQGLEKARFAFLSALKGGRGGGGGEEKAWARSPKSDIFTDASNTREGSEMVPTS